MLLQVNDSKHNFMISAGGLLQEDTQGIFRRGHSESAIWQNPEEGLESKDSRWMSQRASTVISIRPSKMHGYAVT